MHGFEQAVLPLSFKESRRRVEGTAALLAAIGMPRVVLVHCAGGTDGVRPDLARTELAGRKEIFEAVGLEVATEVLGGGGVANMVCNLVTADGQGLLCLVWREKSWLKRTLLGGPDTDMLRLCRKPILISKQDSDISESSLQRVLHATDFESVDKRAPPSLGAASAKAAELILLHVRERAPDPATNRSRHAAAEAHLVELARIYGKSNLAVRAEVAEGSVIRAILNSAYRHNADLIVVGRKRAAGSKGFLRGTVAEILPYRTHRSILIIP
ncbi:MAG: universal stress protein [Opitutales bacterium]